MNSDNGGDTICTKGHPGNNYSLRSAKFQYFEGGIRVPAFIYAPWVKNFEANFGGKEYRGLMHHVDLLPTFVHIGQGELDTNDYEIDGHNMWPSILGTKPSPRTELWLNLPRNKDWDTGERKTEEGVAVRKLQALLNHVYDEWFSPMSIHKIGIQQPRCIVCLACTASMVSIRMVALIALWGLFI